MKILEIKYCPICGTKTEEIANYDEIIDNDIYKNKLYQCQSETCGSVFMSKVTETPLGERQLILNL